MADTSVPSHTSKNFDVEDYAFSYNVKRQRFELLPLKEQREQASQTISVAFKPQRVKPNEAMQPVPSDWQSEDRLAEALAIYNKKRQESGLPPVKDFHRKTTPYLAESSATEHEEKWHIVEPSFEKNIPVNVTSPVHSTIENAIPDEVIFSPVLVDHPAPSEKHLSQETIDIWSILLLIAIRKKAAGAVRAWSLLSHLPGYENGAVKKSDLLGLLEKNGIPRSTTYKWIREAIELGLMTEARHQTVLRQASQEKVFEIFELSDPGLRVTVPIKEFLDDSWKDCVWAGFLCQHEGSPIARDTLQQISGVKPRTQLNYEKSQRKVEVSHNFAIDERFPATSIDGYKENIRHYAFITRDGATLKIAFQLANTYSVDPTIAKHAGGVYRSWNYRLNHAMPADVSVSSVMEDVEKGNICHDRAHRDNSTGGGAISDGPRRRFFHNYKAFKKARSRLRKKGKKGALLFELIPGGLGCHAWYHKSTCGWYRLEEV